MRAIAKKEEGLKYSNRKVMQSERALKDENAIRPETELDRLFKD